MPTSRDMDDKVNGRMGSTCSGTMTKGDSWDFSARTLCLDYLGKWFLTSWGRRSRLSRTSLTSTW
jgi:hypothetical protein